MKDKLQVLCVHGVNTDEADPNWVNAWREAVTSSLKACNPQLEVGITFLGYNDLFAAAPMPPQESVEAFLKLGTSWVVNTLAGMFHPSRGLDQLPGIVRWTAGMVVQWSEDSQLRTKLGSRLEEVIAQVSPSLICAHSLGSLVTYDTLVRHPEMATDRTLVVFGSQIGNPALRTTLMGGRLMDVVGAKRFFHLYNRFDPVLTYRFNLSGSNYRQLETTFDRGGLENHNPVYYLTHPVTKSEVWPTVAGGMQAKLFDRAARSTGRLTRRREHRALLVGINDYPDEANRLDGCVNDTYRVSAMLQEHGFPADSIRVLLDRRATKQALVERLDWLLDDAREGDQRVLFYSGHGAQLPIYGPDGVVDHIDECLVPVDFDWTQEHAFTDKEFCERYSQLPYGVRLVTILDCCHSGGMARAGGARVRGLTPPDDIRHRIQEWNGESRTWQDRVLLNADTKALLTTAPGEIRRKRYFGDANCAFRPLGRAAQLRWATDDRRRIALRTYQHKGPYMPVLLTACRSRQLSYEYREGTASYGAFTYVFTSLIDRERRQRKRPSIREVVAAAGSELARLGYAQAPGVEGPKEILKEPLAWSRTTAR